MEYKGLKLDRFQREAIEAIEANKSVVVSAPTGSGKTLIADFIIDRDFNTGKRVVYTAPIKALSNQKYKDFARQYGEDNVGMLTGDVVKNSSAPILIMTTEIYRNMCMVNDPIVDKISYVIFDEIHFINDPERGVVWEESIIFSKPHVRMLCLSATIPNAQEFADWIAAIKGHPVIVVRHDVRPVPLSINFYDTDLGICQFKDLHYALNAADYKYVKGRGKRRQERLPPPNHTDLIKDIEDKLPCMFFSFSRAAVQQKAEQLSKIKLFKPDAEITTFVSKRLSSAPPEVSHLPSTKTLRHVLSHQIGFHHAGLLPIHKEIVEDLFGMGKLKVLYTTETFAVGLNMPAKSVCFEALRKFDGRGFRMVDSKEFYQIAGRAGRRGIDTEGFVFCTVNRQEFDFPRTKKLIGPDTTPIQSQFKLGVNTVLNLVKHHTEEEIEIILRQSFYSYQKYGKNFATVKVHRMHSTFENYLHKLEKLGYLTKDKQLTETGEFLTQIYADELYIGEIFARNLHKQLNPYQLLLLLGAICWEGKKTTFGKPRMDEESFAVVKLAKENPVLKGTKRFDWLKDLTALFYPLYHGATFFELLDTSDMLEGDVIRYLRQIVDRLNQIHTATNDLELKDKTMYLKSKLLTCLETVDV